MNKKDSQPLHGSFNHLVKTLGDEIGHSAAKLFGSLVKGSIDGTMCFADSASLARTGVAPEEIVAARTTLAHARLIRFRRWPIYLSGGDYSLAKRGFEVIAEYWPEFLENEKRRKAVPAKKVVVQPIKPKFVVVRPSELKRPLAA